MIYRERTESIKEVVIQIVSGKRAKFLLVTSLLLGLAGFSHSMSRQPTEQIPIEFVRVGYEKGAQAIVTELVIPNIDAVENLSRIELLIYNDKNEAMFGVMLNYGDRLDPIPPGNFGVIIDPTSDDRSIKNVSSAVGLPGRFDHFSPPGTLLKQSARDVIHGNLGISIWIVPQDWAFGKYTIKTRAVKWKHLPSPWQVLATFDYSEKNVSQLIQNSPLVKPVFFILPWNRNSRPDDHIDSVTLIRYEKQPQDEGVIVKRWAGDTASQYKYVEKEKRALKLIDFSIGLIPVGPGIYQLKHSSVNGQPPSGFYGQSNFFEIKADDEIVEVQIPLYPAI